MLLTLSTRSLQSVVTDVSGGMSLLDVPEFTAKTLQLRGLNLVASMLKGWSLDDLDTLRDRADKAGCPCLVLVEDTPLRFADPDPSVRRAAQKRMILIGRAAHRLGCNSLAVKCEAENTDEAFEETAEQIKEVMPSLERLELNILLASHVGLTSDPDRLTELIKRIGGFRIGSLPQFDQAASTGDITDALRKLAPYAGAIHATIKSFKKTGDHNGYDLTQCVHTIAAVGFENTLAIEYTGKHNPVPQIERARTVLQEAIDQEPPS